MELLIVAGLLVLNFGISWWNAWAAGMIWLETRSQGGFMRLVAWSAAIQSAFGFTMVFAILLGIIAFALHLLKANALVALMELTYLLVIVPLLGSGLVITIHTYIVAYRERSLLSMGASAWNTFAMAHNALDAVNGIGEAFSGFTNFVKSDDRDEDGAGVALILLLVAVALGGGIVLTYVIARSSMHKLALPEQRRTWNDQSTA